jgi:5'-3' exonuclease
MGIKYLNSFLKENCPESIKCVSMADMSGKKIAIDISIYLYKYAGDDCLIENIYLMISIFRYYNITPIFVFDGKPPAEKKELLKQRKVVKKDAENEYNRLKSCLSSSVYDTDKQEIIANMDTLKKQFVYVNKFHIEKVKELIDSFGVTYVDAPGEADELCAMLVIKKRVWACLSEDMDMFVYGCPRVLRYFSLLNHTAVLYKMKYILNELDITQKEFRQLCVLSGTDYNISNDADDGPNLHKTIKLFRKYKKAKQPIDFYEWIKKNNAEYIENSELLTSVYSMFELSDNNDKLNMCEKIRIVNSPVSTEKMRPILEDDGFIFPCNVHYHSAISI